MLNNDADILRKYRAIHRKARGFLSDPEMKTRIKGAITERKSTMEKKAIWNVIIQVIQIIQAFPTNIHSRIFAQIMPQLTSQLPSIEDSEAIQPQ